MFIFRLHEQKDCEIIATFNDDDLLNSAAIIIHDFIKTRWHY